MIASSSKWLRVFLAGAIFLAAGMAYLVFSGIIPPYFDREFTDADFGEPRLDYRIITFDDLPGWRQDDPGPALAAFVRSCASFESGSPEDPANAQEHLGEGLGDVSFGGVKADWRQPCAEARALLATSYGAPSVQRGAHRKFFEFHFRPVAIVTRSEPLPDGPARRALPRIEPTGVFTGYFEPVYKASEARTDEHSAPLYPRPDDLVEVDLGQFREELKGQRIAGRVANGRLQPFDDRAQINGGALNGALEPIAWLDPNDLFFLQIQGSGRLVFEGGRVMRVGYAAQNGHPYTAIGRVMVQDGVMPLEQVSMQSIRNWLSEASAEDAMNLREANASYVFFRELAEVAPELGPLGAQGVPLTPGRSVAVDRRYHTLGAPVWVDIEPVAGAGQSPIRQLMIAQDTGGAIRGPVRGDYFWGPGDDAGRIAGAMNAKGRMTVLLPRKVVDRLEPRTAQAGYDLQ